jgi:hypothetical protein
VSGKQSQARRETVAPLSRPIAADPFEARIENRIMREDCFELDGDTLLRFRRGQIETCDVDAVECN